MTPIQFFISIVKGVVDNLRTISLSPLGLPNVNMLQFDIALLVGFTGLALLGKDDDDDD